MTTLLSSTQSGSLILTLNRPERANSFNIEMVTELQRALADAETNPLVRCVVLTGSGKVFSAGQDISEMKKGGDISYREHLEKTYNPLILQIRKMGKPVIAAVNGPCAGAALGVALACDLRIAKTSAYFVVGFGGIALAPDSGVSLLLPVYIGLGRAQEYFYSNKPISVHLAHQWGMVNQVGGFNFQTLVNRVAGNLASGPLEAFAAGKKAFNEAVIPNLEHVLTYEGILQEEAGKTAEHREGVAAFLGKRKPKFT
ncbi:MAG: enoyl-CoA hydratase/isomerase family protein [Anaerolineales bacterium]|uniref:enoyl-CoA hydratase/isomerase family protein n=1 Tax=Candidatus Villigracilis proximus TaxID=3140683 RepID=UPI0031376C6E|nr:enoyl-CoA hydratase/isomerase family protein [Anaerolineales bacterium]